MRVFNPVPGLRISIHALTRRAAYWKIYNDWFRDISIHALTRRAAATYSM